MHLGCLVPKFMSSSLRSDCGNDPSASQVQSSAHTNSPERVMRPLLYGKFALGSGNEYFIMSCLFTMGGLNSNVYETGGLGFLEAENPGQRDGREADPHRRLAPFI